ncbi:hypothetical protein ACJIZ3_017216 [Penstemon smallii]|uniref:Queuine tRNA-ribosyltransferase accessory subunit 2 n=1 Tax=Penstemon smallii TaxID=265156 RepID=A0ABD3SUY5_9LAMI
MKFRLKAFSNGGGARAGVLQLGSNCSIETPALLLTTIKGLPAFISPDLLSSLPTPDSRLLQFSPLHFLEGISLKTISEMGGLKHIAGLRQDCIFNAVPRDSIISLPDFQSSNKTGASFDTPSGRRLIRPIDYMEMISSMKPDMWVSLADEVPSWVSEKRNTTSVDRTITWLDDCITSNLASITFGAVFGSIVGGSRIEERRRCAQEVAKRNVSGFYIAGFGLGESIDERPDLLGAVIESIPEEKPRQISGLGLPEEVLQGVAAGIDLFDSTYIYQLTLGGFALTFPLKKFGMHSSDDGPSDIGSDGTKINLKATIYRKDTSPILESCQCYTCQNHTKAYINHLFNVHEMLAQILLEIHNTHHYLGFFRVIRKAIVEGKFEHFRQSYIETRRNSIYATALSA